MSNRIAERTYGTVSAERQREMSGLEFVQGLADGTLPLNTIAETLGYDVVEAASGRVVLTAADTRDKVRPDEVDAALKLATALTWEALTAPATTLAGLAM